MPFLCHTVFMTGKEAVDIIRGLGISQARFARLANLHVNSVTKWANGHPPSGPAAALLRLLQLRPEMVAVLESENGR